MLKDKVLRHSKVKVGKKAEDAGQEPADTKEAGEHG
jgi:hypothetical protein